MQVDRPPPPRITHEGTGWEVKANPRNGPGPMLNLWHHWNPEAAVACPAEDIRWVWVDLWRDDNLDFLHLFPRIEKLSLSLETTVDTSAVEGVTGLQGMSISGSLTQIDFTKLKNLTELSIGNERSTSNWHECSGLKFLSISNMKIPDLTLLKRLSNLQTLWCGNKALKSFEGIAALTSLEELSCSEMLWTDLDGIDSAAQLKTLKIFHMPKLADISKLSAQTSLRSLSLIECRSLRDVTPIAALEQLRFLCLEEAKEIESIKSFSALKNLRGFDFVGNGKVLDGDMRVLLDLPALQLALFRNWKHYTHSREEIREAIVAQGREVVMYTNQISLD